MSPIILTARPTDAMLIVRNLRPNSIKEIERVGTTLKKSALIAKAIERSQYSWTGWCDGEVACIWGLDTLTILSDEATLWMISTPLVEEHAFTFIRRSQMFIRELIKQRFTLIHGMVDHDFARSIKWLHWLGFKVDAPVNGMQYFHMNRV